MQLLLLCQINGLELFEFILFQLFYIRYKQRSAQSNNVFRTCKQGALPIETLWVRFTAQGE